MKKLNAITNKLLSLVLVVLMLVGLVPATIVSAAVEANISLEVSIKQGYAESDAVISEVQSGQPFYVTMRYALNAGSTDDKYFATSLRVEVPQNVEVSKENIIANSHIADDENGEKQVSVEQVGGKSFVVFRFVDELAAGSAATLSFMANFKNMSTLSTDPEVGLPQFKATIEGSIIPRGEATPIQFAPANASSEIGVIASSNWAIFKNVNTAEFSPNKDFFQISYDIDVKLLDDKMDPIAAAADPQNATYREPNSYGRLEFDKFFILDTLPTIAANSVIDGAGAQVVEVGMYSNDGTTKNPLDQSQYTVKKDANGDAETIAFQKGLYAKLTNDEATNAQFIKEGDSVNSKFYITVKYPTAQYTSQINEQLKIYTLSNNATLLYSLVGDDSDKTVFDNASVDLSLRESIDDDYKITIKKILKIGSKQILLNGTALANGYLPASFDLYTDKECTKPAQMYDRISNMVSDVPTIAIDSNNKDGKVSFEHLRRGDYYLVENSYDGFSLTAPKGIESAPNPIKITILADGKIKYYDGTEQKDAAGDNTLTLYNTANNDGVGVIEFVKMGISAKGGNPAALNGINFELYEVGAEGTRAESPTQVKTSGMDSINGYVRFDAVKPGKYEIVEVLVTQAHQDEYIALPPLPVTAKSNEVVLVSNLAGSNNQLVNYSPKGSFTLEKVDIIGKELFGAIVDIYFDENDNGIYDSADTVVANDIEIGSYSSGAVKTGTYFVVETQAPDGYKKLEAPAVLTVSERTTTKLDIQNEKLGWLTVYKYGKWKSPDGSIQNETTGLFGAEFEVFNSNSDGSKGTTTGQIITTIVDATGKPSYDRTASIQLPSGTYWVQETKAPTGYALDPTSHKVVVKSGDTRNQIDSTQPNLSIVDGHTVISITNTTSNDFGRIHITKIDKSTNLPLEGITFEIYSDIDTAVLVDTVITDVNGTAVSTPLIPGNYFVKEADVPTSIAGKYVGIGLLKGTKVENGKNIAVSIGNGIAVAKEETLGLIIENEPFVDYSFTKTDSATDFPILNGQASFDLYDQNPDGGDVEPILKNVVSNANGIVTFSKLMPAKTYWYKEITAPQGYVIDQTIKEFVAPQYVQSGLPQVFENDKELTLRVIKQGVFDGQTVKLSGATFNLYRSDATKEPADINAQFAADSGKYTPTGIGPSSYSGVISVSNLAPGGYWLVETKSPDGYALDEQPIFVVLPQGGTNQTYIYEKTVDNVSNKGALKIEKLNAITSEKMDGITFRLINEKGGIVSTQTTKADGFVSFNRAEPGVYSVEEIAPDGFVQPEPITNILIKAGETTLLTGESAVKNQPMGKIKIQKNALWKGVNGAKDLLLPLEGAEFEIIDSVGTAVGLMTSDNLGVAQSDWLPNGTYTVKEKAAPAGYAMDSSEKTITIQVTKTTGVFEPSDAFVNTPIGGKLRLLKTDNNKNPLSGVVFKVYREDPNGTPTQIDYEGEISTKNLTYVSTITTDANGIAITDSIPVGDYYFEEVSAPVGYAYFTKWTGVRAVVSGQVTDHVVENYPTTSGDGSKVDDRGTGAVNGAYIGLFTNEQDAINAANRAFTAEELNLLLGREYDGFFDTNEWNIAQCVKTTSGKYTFNNMNTALTYYVVELLAPANYVRNIKVFTVEAQNKSLFNAEKVFALPTIHDDRVGSIEIFKSYYMDANQRPLKGAKFELYHAVLKQDATENGVKKELNKIWDKDSSGLSMGSIVSADANNSPIETTTNANGSLTFTHLVPGYYLIRETKAPEGFTPDTNKYYLVEVSAGANSNYFKAANAIKNVTTTMGEFTIKKVVANTNTLLSGVKFQLQKYDGAKWNNVSQITTNNKQYISAPIVAGKYRIVELSAPSNYTILKDPIEFTVEVGKSTTVHDNISEDKVNNFLKGSLELEKIGVFEGKQEQKLQGVKFKLYSDKSMTAPVQEEKTTDANGDAKWVGLDAGTYYVVETSVGANDAYTNSNTVPIEVKIEAGKATLLKGAAAVENIAKYGKIAIKKTDSITKEAIANAVFQVFDNAECNGAAIASIKTNSTGIGLSSLLPPATYWFKETTTPSGYLPSSKIYGSVVVEENKTNEQFKDSPIENKRAQTVNILKHSSIDKSKKPITTGEFVFELYEVKADGSQGVLLQTASTKNVGVLTGYALFSKLLPDTEYYVVEKSVPENYIKAEAPIKFKTLTDGKTQIVEFENVPKGKLEITKITTWDTGEEIVLSGAKFQVYSDEECTKNVGNAFVSNSLGIANSSWLEAGTYYLKETESPNQDAFVASEETFKFVVSAGETTTKIYNINDDSTEITKLNNDSKWGKFKVSKFATGTTTSLSGATFVLKAYNGAGDDKNISNYTDYSQNTQFQTATFTVTSETINGVLTNGVYISGYVPSNKYAIVETAAPSGFTVDSTPEFFEVSAKNTVEIEKFNNAKGSIQIKKISTESTDNKIIPIKGVAFELYAGLVTSTIPLSQLRLVDTQYTDTSGVCTFIGLDAGQYTIREKSTAEGYKLSTTLYPVTVVESGTVLLKEQTIKNEPDMGVGYIFKYAQNGNQKTGLQGATFQIYADAGCTTKVGGEISSNVNGYAITPMLTPATYWVKETKAPDGYMLDERYAPTVMTLRIKALHNPDITNSDIAKRQNYVEMLNVKVQEPVGMPVSLQKTVNPTKLNDSLLNASSTVDFSISNFTTGKNSLPIDAFTITDNKIEFLDANGKTIAPTNNDYSMRSVLVNKAYIENDPKSSISATVYYQVNGTVMLNSGTATWMVAEKIDDLQNLNTDGHTVALPAPTNSAKVTGIKVVYSGTDVKFSAEPIIINTELIKRPEGNKAVEPVLIKNSAMVSFKYVNKNNKGEIIEVVKQANASTNITAPLISSEMPVVKLSNTVSGGSTRAHSLGETLSYTVIAKNTNENKFENPIITIDIPAYTSVDINSVKVMGPDGKTLGSINNVQNPAIVSAIDPAGISTQRLVLSFNGVTLLNNQQIKITYDTVIDVTAPKNVVELISPAFVTSSKKLPITATNLLGTSFKSHATNATAQANKVIDVTVSEILNAQQNNEYIKEVATATVAHSDMVSIVKQQKNALDTTFKNAGQIVYVHPDGQIDYKLMLVNNLTNPVKTIRVVDVFPVLDDTLVLRSTSTGTIFERSTEIPKRPILTGPVSAQVPVSGAVATVYYKVDTAWDKSTRQGAFGGASNVEKELPMLYKNDGTSTDTWSGWLTEAQISASGRSYADVTAIGIDVEYPQEALMQSGDTYSAVVSLKMPGFTAKQISEFYNKKIANSAAASVRENNSAKPWLVENVQVLSYMRLPVGSIGDYVFFDNDNDGLQSAGDTPISNIKVTLARTDTLENGSTNMSVYTTTTDTNGLYIFNDLPSNYLKTGKTEGSTNPSDYVGEVYTTYSVTFEQPVKIENGAVVLKYAPTMQNVGTDDAVDSDIDSKLQVRNIAISVVEKNGILVGEQNLTIDAGFVAPCSIGDYVWLDTNRNGIQDVTEIGVESAVVRLYRVVNGKSVLEATTTTDATGKYLFDNLVPGTFEVEFDISSLIKTTGYTYKYAFTKSNAADPGGQSTVDLDSDAVYTKDIDDRVRRTSKVTLLSGDNNMSVDAGLTFYSAIGGFIFDDRNYNDYQDLMYPLVGTKVSLYGSINGAIDESIVLGSKTVDGTGRFLFDNLIEGTYYIKYDFPAGYGAVNPRKAIINGVNDETLDSNCETNISADYNTGYSVPIVLQPDSVDTTWDAGARKYGAIGDYVWFDENKDGIQDVSESGVANVEVVLQHRSISFNSTATGQWQFSQRAVTDKDGYYLFRGLQGGADANIEYRVVFMPPKQYETTGLNLAGDIELDSDALSIYIDGLGYPTDIIRLGYGQVDMTWDAGLVEVKSTLGDYIWFDANRNGVQDNGEAVLKGIWCILEKNGTGDLENPNAWTEAGRMQTNDEGRYRFDNLAEGYYRVIIGLPNVYSVTRLERGAGQSSNEIDSDAIYQTASATLMAHNIANFAQGISQRGVVGLTAANPNVTPFGTTVIDHTNAEQNGGVTFFKTRTIYLDKNTVDLTWDVGVYTVQTGDGASPTMWIGIASMSLTTMFLLWYLLNRKKLRGEI